jgi:hypothetical protein
LPGREGIAELAEDPEESKKESEMDMPERKRRPFYLYVDEAHNFVTDTLTQLLAEARKFGLSLTLASQNLMQLAAGGDQNTMLEAVLGNVGTLILFRMGPFDADRLVAHVRPHLDVSDLMYMPDYTAAAKLLSAGRPSLPFLLSTLPPMRAAALSAAQRRKRQRTLATLRQTYPNATGEVEASLRRRYVSTLDSDESDNRSRAKSATRSGGRRSGVPINPNATMSC